MSGKAQALRGLPGIGPAIAALRAAKGIGSAPLAVNTRPACTP